MASAPRRLLLRLLVIAFPLYFSWEILQMPAFAGLPESRLVAAGLCALAALGDVAIVFIMWRVGAAIFRDREWYAPATLDRYAVIAAAGVVLHGLLEWLAMHRLALWSYRTRVPRPTAMAPGCTRQTRVQSRPRPRS